MLLRLVKPAIAAVLGLLIYLTATTTFGAGASFELLSLCWISAAAFILLVQEGPL